eukprot:1266205-Alexandrium_andersonii.AAC.1
MTCTCTSEHDTSGHAPVKEACNCTATQDDQQARAMPPRKQAASEETAGPTQQSIHNPPQPPSANDP